MIDELQTTERLVFDGALSVTTAVTLMVAFALSAAWLLWRERMSLGLGWASAFWGMRMAAVGMALWMAVGPMQESVEKMTKSQSISILADASQSMDTIDPLDPAAAIRWSLASNASEEPTVLVRCDRAIIAAGVADLACKKARQQLVEHRPLRHVESTVSEAHQAIERVEMHCEQIAAELSDNLAERVSRIESQLDGPIGLTMDSLFATLSEENQAANVRQLDGSLEILAENITGVKRRLRSLARNLVSELVETESANSGEFDELTRRDKVGLTLDSLEQNVFSDLTEGVRIRRFRFDQKVQPVAAERKWAEFEAVDTELEQASDEPSAVTDLSEVLKQLAEEKSNESTRFAVIFSDGHHNNPDSPAPQDIAADLMDLPVYVVPVGNSLTQRDIRLHRVEAPSTVVENDSAVIEAIVTAMDCDGLSAKVVLRHEGKEIDRKAVQFVGDRIDRRVQFTVPSSELGWQEYELTVEPIEDEASDTNNVAPVSWEVVRDKFRVLLADGMSRWEYRYLQQLFRRDAHIEFDELLFYPRLRGTGDLAAKRRLPDTVDDWAVYDVVILGDIGVEQIGRESQATLVEYVRQGHGHLILIAGKKNMPGGYVGQPLMELLPVENEAIRITSEAYTLALTDEGRLHSALAIEATMPASEASWLKIYQSKPVHNLSSYCRPKATARTLIRALPVGAVPSAVEDTSREDQQAFLSWHQVGAGRVVYLAAPQTYMLRFRRSDEMHHRFWGQMLRWITATNIGSGSEMVRLMTDLTRYQINESVEVTAWLKDQTGRPLSNQSLHAIARSLDKEVASILLEPDPNVGGRYFNRFEDLAPGAYEIVVEGQVVDDLGQSDEEVLQIHRIITIETNDNLELLDTRCNRTLLEQVAELTGGQMVPPTALAEVFHLASLSPEVSETVQRSPLWNRWLNLWIVVGCLIVEWVVRKRKGLV